MFVDFCGDTLQIADPDTGEVWEAQVFVSELAASGYMFVEATGSQDPTSSMCCARRLHAKSITIR